MHLQRILALFQLLFLLAARSYVVVSPVRRSNRNRSSWKLVDTTATK